MLLCDYILVAGIAWFASWFGGFCYWLCSLVCVFLLLFNDRLYVLCILGSSITSVFWVDWLRLDGSS